MKNRRAHQVKWQLNIQTSDTKEHQAESKPTITSFAPLRLTLWLELRLTCVHFGDKYAVK